MPGEGSLRRRRHSSDAGFGRPQPEMQMARNANRPSGVLSLIAVVTVVRTNQTTGRRRGLLLLLRALLRAGLGLGRLLRGLLLCSHAMKLLTAGVREPVSKTAEPFRHPKRMAAD